MSLALIEESAKEVRRLAIAGSPLAVGDFRLKKLIPPLEQAGGTVPVFAQVAKSIGELANGKEADSPANLLKLSTLLNAILYTQGQSGTDGALRQPEVLATNSSSTRTTARVLRPLIQALTSSGGGRFEVIKAACEGSAFKDLRLIDPAIQALGDSYPELAELVAERILPGYGPGIVPRLKATFEVKGKKHDARKLAVMHKLDPAGTLALCQTALEDGSPEVKAVAIACLGKHEDCLPLVLEQASAKNKLLRAAALEALAEHDRPEIIKLFGELIKGKALDILVGPFRMLRNRQVLNSLLAEGQRVFALILKGESEQIPRFREILDCLKERKEAETEEFLLACFEQCERLPKPKAPQTPALAGADLLDQLVALLYYLGSPKPFRAILAKQDVLPPTTFAFVFHSALLTWSPAKVYEEFSPLLKHKKGVGKEKTWVIERALWATSFGDLQHFYLQFDLELGSSEVQRLKTVVWDPRWLDAAIAADQPRIVCCLAGPGHKSAVAYLLKQLAKTKPQIQAGLVLQVLARCQYPKLTDVFLDLVAQKVKNPRYFDFEWNLLFESARYLPAADLPRLDAFAAKLDERFVDHFLEALAPLRLTKSDPSDPSAAAK